MPTHSSSLHTRTSLSSLSAAIGNSRPLLVTMSGTAQDELDAALLDGRDDFRAGQLDLRARPLL